MCISTKLFRSSSAHLFQSVCTVHAVVGLMLILQDFAEVSVQFVVSFPVTELRLFFKFLAANLSNVARVLFLITEFSFTKLNIYHMCFCIFSSVFKSGDLKKIFNLI